MNTTTDDSDHHAVAISAMAILMLLGGHIVTLALAQIAGSGFAPITFSFGWVAVALNTLITDKFHPKITNKIKVINAETGFQRDNNNWILNRIVCDFRYWYDRAVADKVKELFAAKLAQLKKDGIDDFAKLQRVGLCVSIYRATPGGLGRLYKDSLFYSGLLVTLVQLVIASSPFFLDGDINILSITVAGTLLAWSATLLPQWAAEKWSGRTKSIKNVILTEGNGAQHAILVWGGGMGFDLEDLANGYTVKIDTLTTTVAWLMASLWVVLLAYIISLTDNVSYLLVIGTIGMFHDVHLASTIRKPKDYGLPLEFQMVYGETKVMETLLKLERDYPGAGASLLPIPFPGPLDEDEVEQWSELGITMPKKVVVQKIKKVRTDKVVGKMLRSG
ncbi:Hypothetical protein D9617_19g103480 [Elsinoe fawcettii]|nr:Hypothetical protein D9617_19g103480 [Elsinoe fawcettii]